MKRFCVIGLGKFGISVAKALSRKGAEVIAIDTDEERVNEASNFATQAIILDATDKEALQRIGIQDIDAAIVAVGKDMASSILITSLLKELGVKYVVAKALNPLHGKVLEKVGADRVVFPERDMGMRVAQSLLSPSIFDYIALSPQYSLIEFVAPQQFFGKSLKELDLRNKYGVMVIAIKKKIPEIDTTGETSFHEDFIIAPELDTVIDEGDILIILGHTKNIEKLRRL